MHALVFERLLTAQAAVKVYEIIYSASINKDLHKINANNL